MKLFFLALSLSAMMVAQVTVTVPATTVITLAGQPAGTQSTKNQGSAPLNSPVQVNIPFVAGQALRITATGSVDGAGPDGSANCTDFFRAEFSIPEIDSPCRTLVGVFLGDSTRPQPPAVDFRGDSNQALIVRPLIQQPFMIGSGLNAAGDPKVFVVPTGATRLFLSAVANANSTGSFGATVSTALVPDEPGNPVRVSGASVITLANQAAGTISNNTIRSAPLNAPAQVNLPLIAGQVLRIVASGSVDGAGPDGQPNCNDFFRSEFSVAEIDAHCRALVGVFLGDTVRAQPPKLDFTGGARNNQRLEPLIQQPFLIGSGYTDAGDLKQFVIPPGATHLAFSAVGNSNSKGFFIVTVSPDSPTTPVVTASGITAGAGFGRSPLAPGAIAAIFGSNLAVNSVPATSVPLPTLLDQTRVYFNLRPAPLYFTSAGQVNVQVPWELSSETSAQLVVTRNGAASMPIAIPLAAVDPGIFLVGENTGAVVSNSTGQLVDQQTPVQKGDALIIYASGLGLVTGTVTTGAPASATTLEPTKLPVEAILTIGGQSVPLQVLFAGSAPTFIGVNQVNALIPSNTPSGVGRLKLRTGGAESNEVVIAVQ